MAAHASSPAVLEVGHDKLGAGEGEYRDESEGQLETHKDVEQVVHPRQLVDPAEHR